MNALTILTIIVFFAVVGLIALMVSAVHNAIVAEMTDDEYDDYVKRNLTLNHQHHDWMY